MEEISFFVVYYRIDMKPDTEYTISIAGQKWFVRIRNGVYTFSVSVFIYLFISVLPVSVAGKCDHFDISWEDLKNQETIWKRPLNHTWNTPDLDLPLLEVGFKTWNTEMFIFLVKSL